MVIKGTVHNDQVQIENSVLPDGTKVLISPVHSTNAIESREQDLEGLKADIRRIASLSCENTCDNGFSGSDHDKILYGN